MPVIKPKEKISKVKPKKPEKSSKKAPTLSVEAKIQKLAAIERNLQKEILNPPKVEKTSSKTEEYHEKLKTSVTSENKPKESLVKEVSETTEDVQINKSEDAKEIEDKTETEIEKEEENMTSLKEVKVVESCSFVVRFLIPALVGAIVGIITASVIILIYNTQFKKEKDVKTMQDLVTPSPQPVASPTEANSLVKDLSLYDIKVLNGSGKGGEAARVEKLLKAGGFAVLEIGNADKSTYKKTVIQAKDKVPSDFLQKLEEVLTKSFDLDTLEKLDDKEEVDIVVIVGSSPNAQSTVSATPKVSPTKVLE